MRSMRFLLLWYSVVCLYTVQANNHFTLQAASSSVTQISENTTYSQNTVVPLSFNRQSISGLSINGQITKSSPDYCVRVVLTDTNGNKYLVMEAYEEIQSEEVFSFSDYCEETALLKNVQPSELCIFLKDATLKLSNISVTGSLRKNNEDIEAQRKTIRQNQTSTIIEKINAYNKAHNKLWVAGETKLSKCDYATKIRILGDNQDLPTGGWEYYVGGIFEIGHSTSYIRNTDDWHVPDFDWRTQHGKNLVGPVRDQGWSSFCTAFAAISCIETLVNLYYNKKMDIDLSEQEIASCADSVPIQLWEKISRHAAFSYIVNHGVCDEQSYPFDSLAYVVPCRSDSTVPLEKIKVTGTSNWIINDSDVKTALISKGPLWASIRQTSNSAHAMTLIGYHTLKAGDTVYYAPNNNIYYTDKLIVNDDDSRIGCTYWVFKDSYRNAGYTEEGYRYIYFNNGLGSNQLGIYSFDTPIISTVHTDNDIVWEDLDGDGLYNWGIGSKPSSCPSWVPDTRDGDDSDPSKGEYDNLSGNCHDFYPNNHPTTIYGNEVFDSNVKNEYNLTIKNNSTLTIKERLHCVGNPVISVENGGTLVIDGGYIYNADLRLYSGSNLIIKNGGTISMRKNTDFLALQGAQVIIENGSIE